MNELRKRIEALTDAQREELAKVLGCENVGRQSLVAYVSPAPASGEALTAERIRDALSQKLPGYMVPSSIVVLDALERLPNGKIDTRALLLADFVEKTVSPCSEQSASELEQALTNIWMEVLGTNDVRRDDNFFEIGGDSIMSIRIVALCREAGLIVTPNDLMENQTIAELSTVVRREEERAPHSDAEVLGEVPLTPIQNWFFELDLSSPEHWNQAMLIGVPAGTDEGKLEAALAAVFVHHDILRARFHHTSHGWIQTIPPAEDFALPQLEVRQESIEEVLRALHREIQLDSSLARFALIPEVPEESPTLVMILHHLIVDNVSWRVILDDLASAYEQSERGTTISLPPKTASYRQWSEHLRSAAANAAAMRAELEYWARPVPSGLARLPVDMTGDEPLVERDSNIVTIKLTENQTSLLLKDANTAYNTRAHDLLMVALVQTLLRWSGGDCLRLGLEGFGRDSMSDGMNVSRSVGWFTAFYTMTLQLDPSAAEDPAIKTIKEQLRELPNRGLGYGLLRYLSPERESREAIRRLPAEEVLFNYLGTLPAVNSSKADLIQSVRSNSEFARAPENQRSHLLEINAFIDGGELEVLWTYNSRAHTRETIEEISDQYIDNLSKLISHCLATESGGYTPSDFPDADLDQDDLDRFLDSIG